jgi:hypothetical protein
MNISIFLTAGNGEVLSTDMTSLDENFKWESEHIPAVGDNVTIDLEHLSQLAWAYNIGWIDGKVVEREFKTQSNEVELTVEVERSVAEKLMQAISEQP